MCQGQVSKRPERKDPASGWMKNRRSGSGPEVDPVYPLNKYQQIWQRARGGSRISTNEKPKDLAAGQRWNQNIHRKNQLCQSIEVAAVTERRELNTQSPKAASVEVLGETSAQLPVDPNEVRESKTQSPKATIIGTVKRATRIVVHWLSNQMLQIVRVLSSVTPVRNAVKLKLTITDASALANQLLMGAAAPSLACQ